MPRKKQKVETRTQKRSVVFSAQQLKEVEKLAIKKNSFASKIIRDFVDKGLCVEGYKDDIGFLTGIMRQEIKAEIGKQANRLASMFFKVGVVASSNYFLAVRMMSDVISPSMQDDFKDIHTKARQLGIDYMKMNGVGAVEFLEDEDDVEQAAEKLKTDLTKL